MGVNLIPQNDWMLMEEVAESVSSKIDTSAARGMSAGKTSIAFRLLSVGPGYIDQSGKFIKTEYKPGDMVLLDAPMTARFTLYGNKYIAACARNVAFTIKEVK
jgi:co-chaperonin GroES (HSP10)